MNAMEAKEVLMQIITLWIEKSRNSNMISKLIMLIKALKLTAGREVESSHTYRAVFFELKELGCVEF